MPDKNKKERQIILARTAGFCMGVKRAMQMVWDAVENAEDRPIYTYGELIHNPQTIDLLNKKGVKVACKAEDINGGTVIIRAHGISPDVRRRIESRKCHILDATCPHVKKLQAIVDEHSRKGYFIVVLGDKGHAEVMGLLGFVREGMTINSIEEINNVPLGKKICMVVQTTQNEDVFNLVANALKKRCSDSPDVLIFNTICRATHIRQQEVLKIAKQVDAMVIVGGYNSANTVRLATIAAEQGTPTFHIETADELPLAELCGYGNIGVSAGASTPDWLIEEVMTALKEM